jgi:hypothetical protein
LRAFESFLRLEPVHTLSLMNYAIATYACWHGRPPNHLDALRTDSLPRSIQPLEDRAFLDAWGRPLAYRRRGAVYEVRSSGPDRIMRTPDDLVSRQTEPLRRQREYNCR